MASHMSELSQHEVFNNGYSSSLISATSIGLIRRELNSLNLKFPPVNAAVIETHKKAQLKREGLPFFLRNIIEDIVRQYHEVVEYFINGETDFNFDVSAVKAYRGYSRDWSQDCEEQPFLALTIIIGDGVDESDGGRFELAKISYSDDGEIKSRTIVESFVPGSQGRVVVYDPSTLRFQNRITKVNNNKNIYFLTCYLGKEG